MGSLTDFYSVSTHFLLTMKFVLATLVFSVLLVIGPTEQRPQGFNFGAILGNLVPNAVGAAVNTGFGRDCKGRAQGDYFYGCQCIGPFNIGRKKRQVNRLFINSNQGVGGDFARCTLGSVLNRR